uniref:Uncharacterized protein TCIL3000_11_5580 n=1 Tax=Trypanosoma congolense (strain IL3000) TaxID=1068625 RepID=G0V0H3_TRYCI|nr:unnamed protein product [Trypanosoma congolense IL3000]
MECNYYEPLHGFDFEVSKKRLGSGTSGVVFMARHHKSHELVAVKRLYKRLATSLRDTQRFGRQPNSPTDVRIMELPLKPASPETYDTCGVRVEVARPSVYDNKSPFCRYQYSAEQRDTKCESVCCSVDTGCLFSLDNSCSAAQQTDPTLQLPRECISMQYVGPHAHIVRLLGRCTDVNGVTFLGMELMDSDLERELRAGNTALMGEDAIRHLLFGIASAIYHIHQRGVAHRDIKPGNILLKYVETQLFAKPMCQCNSMECRCSRTVFGKHNIETLPLNVAASHSEGGACDCCSSVARHVKAALGDFSAAHFVQESDCMSSFCGTLYYKSPEQLLGCVEDFLPCDMWAFGCTMFEMVTGSIAFKGATDLRVLHEVCAKMGTDIGHFPKKTREQTLFDCLSAQSKEFVDLLKGLLALDPCVRLRADQVLEHAFFRSVRETCGAHNGSTRATFPIRLYHTRPTDTTDMAFKSIVCSPSTQSRGMLMSVSTGTQLGITWSDVQLSDYRQKDWTRSPLISSSPSPCQRSISLLVEEAENIPPFSSSSRHSPMGNNGVNRRLSISSCFTAVDSTPRQRQGGAAGLVNNSLTQIAPGFSPTNSNVKNRYSVSVDHSLACANSRNPSSRSFHSSAIGSKFAQSSTTAKLCSVPCIAPFPCGEDKERTDRSLEDVFTERSSYVSENHGRAFYNSTNSPRVRRVLFR